MAAAAPTVGFVGLGVMGFRMAARLAGSPHLAPPLLVHNRTASKAEQHAAQHGSQPVAALPELAAACDVLFLCLPTSQVVQQLLREAVQPHIRRGSIIVDCTSGDPDLGAALAEELRTAHGVTLLDAPVSGGPTGADAGTLTTMVGGSAAALARVQPLINSYAKKTVHSGERAGSGFALKAVNNILNATHLLVAAEGLLSLQKWGVDARVAVEAISASSGRSMATTHRMPEQVLPRRFAHGFELGLMNKDVQIGAKIVRQACPEFSDALLAQSARIFSQACASIGPAEDYTKAVCYLERIAGQKLGGDRDKAEGSTTDDPN